MPMYKLWDILIKPALDCIELSHIVEIGADAGENTRKILDYCRKRDARLTTIDSMPNSEVLALQEEYGEIFTLSDKTSLEALPELSGYDAILIDGDHNWYTVYHELKAIENTFSGSEKFPIVFFHDVAWPYGRRDMYYSPERIPDEFRQEYSVKGMIPGQSDLVEHLGWNSCLCNALVEGGSRNGVLAAIEDFIKEARHGLRFAAFNGYFGLGLLMSTEVLEMHPKLLDIFKYMDWSRQIGDAMQDLLFENIRRLLLNDELTKLNDELTNQNKAMAYKIADIYNSNTWKTGKMLQKMFRLFIPSRGK